MEPLCEVCGVVRAVIYCDSDSARLCLRCDNNVHSANVLSRRHLRSLLCDKCNLQPGNSRCMDENLCICQTCDSCGNGCSALGHRLQPLQFYLGCPSLADFSRLWTSFLDFPSFPSLKAVRVLVNPVAGDENSVMGPREDEASLVPGGNKLNEHEPWAGASSSIPPDWKFTPSYCKDQTPFFPDELNPSKDYSNSKDFEQKEGGDLCQGIDLDDCALKFGNSDDMIGSSQDHPICRYENSGTGSLLMDKKLSVTESNSPVENALEASPPRQNDCNAFPSSGVAGSSNVMEAMSANVGCMVVNPNGSRNMGLGFAGGQVPASLSLSLSSVTGESSGPDYQDCGLSPAFLTNLDANCPPARDKAKMRYNEKKKTRTYVQL